MALSPSSSRGSASSTVSPTHLGYNAVIGSALTVTANQAYLCPLTDIVASFTFTRAMFYVGATSAGNIDLGLYYSDDESTFNRQWSLGSTACPTANAMSVQTVATQTLSPIAGRRWFIAFGASSGSATFAYAFGTLMGGYVKATSFPLPLTLTSMTQGTNNGMPALILAV